MNSISKDFSIFLIVVLAVSSLTVIFATIPFGLAQSGTNISGIISSDATWTQANSPYYLTGSIQINNGVTLTVEAGTVVNLVSYFIQVDGTLNARGSSTNKIYFSNGQITFTQTSTNWNEQTGSGCLIENAIINETQISIYNSPKINNNIIDYTQTTYTANEIGVLVGSPIISNNNITQSQIPQQIDAIHCGGSAIITNNTISSFWGVGIELDGDFNGAGNSGKVTVSDNNITAIHGSDISLDNGCEGLIVIENNLITEGGIHIGEELSGNVPWQATVQNNTIVNNFNGIYINSNGNLPSNVTIIYNNLQSNNQSNIYMDGFDTVNATNNWWGTTDMQAISQSIQFKYASTSDNVTFIPFLNSPNPQAPAIPTATSPTSTPTVPEFPTLVILPLFLSLLSIAVIIRVKKQAFP